MTRKGRPPLSRERIIISIDPDVLVALDSVAGKGHRADYIGRALRADPAIQEAIRMTQAFIMGQIFARIEQAGVRLSPNAYQMVSTDPAHQFPPLFTHLMEAGKGDVLLDLMNQIDADVGFPSHMDNEQQGQFSLGYYAEKKSKA